MEEEKAILLYIAKCMIGCLIMFVLGEAMTWLDISWVLISMLLVLSPDGSEAVPLALVRVKANLVASFVTILIMLVSPHPMMGICVAIAITIICCYAMGLMAGSRAALAAVIIVALHPGGEHLWTTAALRVFSVVTGCLLALLLTFAFHRHVRARRLQKDETLIE
jgi:uncharacterized membrane protein YccC